MGSCAARVSVVTRGFSRRARDSEEVFFKHWDGNAWVGIYGSYVDSGITQMGYNRGMPGFSFMLDHADRPIFGWSTWYGGPGRVCHWL